MCRQPTQELSLRLPNISAMRRASAVRTVVCVVAALPLGWLVGCQAEQGPPAPTNPVVLRGIVRLYGMAQSNLGRPPRNMDELKAVLAQVTTDDPSKHLTSTRDGEEFEVVWGINSSTSSTDTVVAYEKKGVDGKRMVVTVDGTVSEVSPEEFAKLKFPKEHKPSG
jgi:hypothetical protein